jgi:hypothetical protein
MKKRSWMIGLLGIALMLASCGTPSAGEQEGAAVATVGPTEAVTSKDEVRRISPAEARELVEAGEAVLYDTRSAQSYADRHAAGAISLPESEVPGRLGELPNDKILIFYCT